MLREPMLPGVSPMGLRAWWEKPEAAVGGGGFLGILRLRLRMTRLGWERFEGLRTGAGLGWHLAGVVLGENVNVYSHYSVFLESYWKWMILNAIKCEFGFTLREIGVKCCAEWML